MSASIIIAAVCGLAALRMGVVWRLERMRSREAEQRRAALDLRPMNTLHRKDWR
jgi:hypothetical protein